MDFNVGHGNIWSFILAYGWGILLFLTLGATVAVGLYWVVITMADKIKREEGIKRLKTIAWTIAITLAIAITALGLAIPLHPGN